MRASFRLPRVNELNKSQIVALNAGATGQNLIVGGPGTGKSVIALLRLRNLLLKGLKAKFLVYNKTLLSYSKSLLGTLGQDADACEGYISWIAGQAKKRDVWYEDVQPSKVMRADNRYMLDYQYLKSLSVNKTDRDDEYLIIDEGQDMAQDFYNTLFEVGYRNVFVAADQNQSITTENSSRREIEAAMMVDSMDTIEMTHNYRNTLNIARVAHHFYTNDPASPKIELPENRESNYQKPVLYKYRRESNVYEKIIQKYDQNTDKLIGVIVPNHIHRKRYIKGLENVDPSNFDHPIPNIQTYESSNDTCEIDWSLGGIVVLCEQSCKGLEFDTVFIAEIDDYWAKGGGDETNQLRKKFYVMASRAREELYFLKNEYKRSKQIIDAIMPAEDSDIINVECDYGGTNG